MTRWQAVGLLVLAAMAGCGAALIVAGAVVWFVLLRPLGQAFGG